jgi:hypothetical protein
MDEQSRNVAKAIVSGVMISSFFLLVALRDIYALGSQYRDVADNLLNAVIILSGVLSVLLMPKDPKPVLKWYHYHKNRMIFLCSVSAFLLGAYFFGDGIVNFFVPRG